MTFKLLYVRHIESFRMFYIVSLYRMSFEMNIGAQGRDSSVGIATRYELDGPGIESRCGGEIFRTRPDRPWGPPSLMVTRAFQGVKRPGGGADHPPHLVSRLKKV